MKKLTSCCGVICLECEYYPKDCQGCVAIKGKTFWLQFTGDNICDIYDCCINKNHFKHCGECPSLPCEHYKKNDPTKSKEENQFILENQLKQLKQMNK